MPARFGRARCPALRRLVASSAKVARLPSDAIAYDRSQFVVSPLQMKARASVEEE
ncbi:MAG: hypothetical protein HC769_09440 [Cyanobacteria bacterium CRU_2_1]|nr:hypothetical protein [Cyanobacteria bacterium RU_5_0]NJR59048.1 hypothetical protein [Cyanobacteria bacterium CRU_2_1]